MMKQIYYVIQTIVHSRGANAIKIISLGLGLMMSILLFSRVAYEQSFDTCFKEHENLYQVWKRFHLVITSSALPHWYCSVSLPAYLYICSWHNPTIRI